jgi:lysophospholipase L1-like esterase
MENMKFRLIAVVILISIPAITSIPGCISLRHRRPIVENPCVTINKGHAAVVPASRPAGWMVRHNAILERIKKGNVRMIFVGNSLTQRWENAGIQVWNKYYATRNAVNMGFDGDRTQHVLWRLDHGEIDNISPKLAVVMIGSNHVNGYTVEEISDGIKAVCCRIRTKLPGTKILLLGILPRGDDASAAAAYRLNKASEEASRIADNRMIYYLNISEKFLDKDGNISGELMTADKVHLTPKGYQALADAMEPTISKIITRK